MGGKMRDKKQKHWDSCVAFFGLITIVTFMALDLYNQDYNAFTSDIMMGVFYGFWVIEAFGKYGNDIKPPPPPDPPPPRSVKGEPSKGLGFSLAVMGDKWMVAFWLMFIIIVIGVLLAHFWEGLYP